MLIEKSFGEKIQDINYIDRIGAYGVILNEENKVAVVKTKKGYFYWEAELRMRKLMKSVLRGNAQKKLEWM
ncbi:hypothetical protein [Paraclostridium sp. AKS81]|uniref:hypothetical protein n=1 Tax=Paraclostridium sp. AKS81 TaxID=2876117 RepID=UPI0021E06211|nr:hypothetical protein [Paraclostridium sp. AKS81]MCU9813306.1 hypothetical protein [Paraclostridium sp. AKS81]